MSMTSKEVLERYYSNLLYGNCGFGTVEEELEGLNAIKQDLEKLKQLEKENENLKLENFNQHLVLNGEIDKLKKAIEFLKVSLDLEVDLDHYNLHTDLGTTAFVNVNKEITKNLELLKEVLE